MDDGSGHERPARVLVSGMGGEIGSLVAARLEAEPWVGEIDGFDLSPPRLRLRRARFHLVSPHDRRRTEELVRTVDPEVIVHVGVYEPGSRSNDATAAARSIDAAAGIFTAAAGLGSLRSIVVRSGIEVYGRGRSHVDRPDETVKPRPTSHFGRILHDVESAALAAGRDAHAPVARVRLGPIVGPHIPSPLGRLLRMPLVPFQPGGRGAFSVVHLDDAVAALVWAARHRWDGPINVSGPDDVHPLDAVRLGRRIPVPTVSLGWRPAQLIANAAGAPVPDHVVELLRQGRLADVTLAASRGLPVRTSRDTLIDLFEWPAVTHSVPSALGALGSR